MTRILVTQRVASLQGVDRILVLERGRVAGFDTHEALMRSCEVYRAIVRAQEGVSAHG